MNGEQLFNIKLNNMKMSNNYLFSNSNTKNSITRKFERLSIQYSEELDKEVERKKLEK